MSNSKKIHRTHLQDECEGRGSGNGTKSHTNGKENAPTWLVSETPRPVLITGGAGFIGTNLAHRLLSEGTPVVLYDNLSRSGVERNVEWLRSNYGELVRLQKADVRHAGDLRRAVKDVGQVFHFAAQVAVTTSLNAPIDDFEINARGTLNLLEALRHLPEPPPLVFTSTNKVYGELENVQLEALDSRYQPVEEAVRSHGFGEDCPLHFHSPYGCSKGAACQYVQDYARTFGLRTTVFRMSCIYGPHQFGTEDQGWVAHFLIKALEGAPLTIYGDGKQVRDVLFVEDLVDAFLLARDNSEKLKGRVFNMGGGPANTISLLELMKVIEDLHGAAPDLKFDDWRPADQQYYVSDTRSFSSATGWSPKVDVRTGVTKLYHWLKAFKKESASPLIPDFVDRKKTLTKLPGLHPRQNGKRQPALRSQRRALVLSEEKAIVKAV